MKKQLFLWVLTLCIFIFSGCYSSSPKVKVGEPIQLSQVPVAGTNGAADRVVYKTFEELQNSLHEDRSAVIRGKKTGQSIPVEVYDQDGYLINAYCETLLEVSQVYYGDLQENTVIALYEPVHLAKEGDRAVLYHSEGAPPIGEDEYLFFLNHPQKKGESGYFLCGDSYHCLVGDYEALKEKLEDATAEERFAYDALEYYLSH